MHILLTNDDGINSQGLFTLYQSLKKIARVSVVAPEAEMSAVGHAITLARPLRLKKYKKNGSFFGYALDGTPADCVKIAITALLVKDRPDMVVSGINLGPNVGFHVIYSGTVSAATEGSIMGVSSIAVSLKSRKEPCHYKSAADFTAKFIKNTRKKTHDKMLLNINVPDLAADKIKGVKITRQAKFISVEKYTARRDPRGSMYYWLGGEFIRKETDNDNDNKALAKGYISITPLQFDMTDYGAIDMIKQVLNKK